MADLHLGQTMSKRYRMQSDGAAHTISDIGFLPDKITVFNETGWADGAELVESIFIRGMTNADALQFRNITDNGSTGNSNTVFETTNGITITTNAGGVSDSFSAIGAITGATQTDPVVITDNSHGLSDGDIIRITGVSGMIELNNRRFRVNNTTTNTFEIQDPETRENIDGTNFSSYSSGGQWNLLNRVDANRTDFVNTTFDVTLGSAVVGDDDDILWVEMLKYGEVVDLGDVA